MVKSQNQSMHSSKGYQSQSQIYISLKLVLIGDPRVGKTTLRRNFAGKKFRQNYIPTLGADFLVKTIYNDGTKISVKIWDLSGQYQYQSVHPKYYVGAHGALVVYEINQENPVESLIEWIDRYIEYSGRYSPIMILQNKIDLIDPNDEINYELRHKEIMKKLNVYYEKIDIIGMRTSAKTNKNVDLSFEQYIQKVISYNKEKLAKHSPLTNQQKDGMYTQAAYLITFDELMGPIITAKYPELKGEPSDPEISSAVHLTTAFAFEDLIEKRYLTGRSNWSEPHTHMYYIAFVIKSEQVRGDHILYVLGCNVSRDLQHFLSKYSEKIDGYLHKTMNKFIEFIHKSEFDLSNEEDIKIMQNGLNQTNQHVQVIINSLRKRVHNLISNRLEDDRSI